VFFVTSYEVVYSRFLNSTTDFNLADLDDYTLNEMLKEWLHSAIVKTRTSSDLSRDDENEVFDSDLSEMDVELLAMGMRLAWLDQRINSTEYTNLFVAGKEEKFYSPSSQLSELRALRADTLREMQQLYTYSTYNNNSYFD
jgi:hypothetical protein